MKPQPQPQLSLVAKTPGAAEKPLARIQTERLLDRIGCAVRTLRCARGVSVTELETLSGVNASTIHRLESGLTEPGVATVLALEAALQVSPGWIIKVAG